MLAPGSVTPWLTQRSDRAASAKKGIDMTFTDQGASVSQCFRRQQWIFILILGCFLLTGISELWSQTGRANITGVVSDAQGAVVVGAKVTAINNATGVAVSVTSNGAGAYNIIQLVPGVYTVTVEKEGFATRKQESYTLVAEQNAGVNFILQPGQATETLTVQGQGELVHTETAELGQTINEKTIVELPLNGRNPADLVLLTPGTTNVLNTAAGTHQDYTTMPTDTGASTNGGRQGSTYYMLDGAYNEDSYHAIAAPFPNPDAVEEFSVIGNNFDPRYGFAPGGVVSIVTKGGTNSWHGDLFEFLRNGDLNAKEYFTGSTDEIKRNQFGGSIGGPIKKDKLFAFFNYQGTRQHSQVNGSGTFVPTDAMKTGDFSAYCSTGFTNGLCNDRTPNPNGGGNPLNDFVSGQVWLANVNGNNSSKTTAAQALAAPQTWYPNNFICQDATGNNGNCANTPWAVTPFDSSSLAIATLLPHSSDPLGHLANSPYASIRSFNEETFRVDYVANEHNRISGRGFINFFNQPAFSRTLLSSDRSWLTDWQSYSGTWTWTISPTVVNSLTGSYSRMYDSSNSGLIVNGKPVCFSQFIKVQDNQTGSPCSIEDLSVYGGAGGFGIGQNFNSINRWTWGVSDSVSVSKGKHLFVAGVDVLRQYHYEITNWLALPLIEFGGSVNGTYTGFGFSDFLLGDVGYFNQGAGVLDVIHAWLIDPYVADQIKLTPHLTLSAGLRWEPFLAPLPVGGRIGVFDPTLNSHSTRYPNAPPGMTYPGDPGVPAAGAPSDYRKFEPRLGLAWQPKFLPNTSLRAAYGMFETPVDYSQWGHADATAPFAPDYAFQGGQQITLANNTPYTVPIIPFGDPWSVYPPTAGVTPFPPFADVKTPSPPSSTPFTLPMQVGSSFAPNYKAGTTQSWNASIEHQFGGNWLARAAYVGVESYDESIPVQANYGQYFGPGNPNNGTPIYSNYQAVFVSRSIGTSNYQSGQFTLERRLAHNLQLQANYTYSHTFDDYSHASTAFSSGIWNPRCFPCNRANSDLDTPQRFVLNFVYETPSPAGWSGAMRNLLGGWEISAIYQAQSGTPFSIYSDANNSFSNRGQDLADFVPGVHSAATHPGQGIWNGSGAPPANLPKYFTTTAFTENAVGTFGNTSRNGYFSPGVNTWDAGLSKNIHFNERYRLQFRWEMFNAFNRVTFSAPDSNFLDGPYFGAITATNGAYPPRVMQGALKLFF